MARAELAAQIAEADLKTDEARNAVRRPTKSVAARFRPSRIVCETKRWFSSIQSEISQDYADAQLTHREDIQRSGHEGESTWADLLSKWLPPAYGVGLRKYIIGSDDSVKPFETDIVIFEPAYPQHLRYRAKVHAGGIAAAFSVKLTARTTHFGEISKWSADLAALTHPKISTAEGQLLSGFPTGFLAHSHAFGADPLVALTSGFETQSDAAAHPRDLVDLVCVADLGTLRCTKPAYMSGSTHEPPIDDFVGSLYLAMNDDQEFGAVAHFIVTLYELLGRNDPSLKKLALELATTTGTGQGSGIMRRWVPSAVYDSSFLEHNFRDLFQFNGYSRHI